MKRVRKLLLLLLCTLIVCNLTGCDFIDNIIDGRKQEEQTNVLTKSQDLSMSSETNALMQRATKAAEDARKAEDAYYKAEQSWWPFHPFKKAKAEKASAYADIAYDEFDDARKADDVYQSSAQETQPDIAENSGIKHYLPYIIVAVVVIVLLLVLLLLMKKRGRTAAPVVKTVPKQPAPATVNTTGQFDKAKAYQEKQLKELCAQGGIDYNLVIAKYGDDVKGLSRAYMALESPIRNGASQEEIMSKLK